MPRKNFTTLLEKMSEADRLEVKQLVAATMAQMPLEQLRRAKSMTQVKLHCFDHHHLTNSKAKLEPLG